MNRLTAAALMSISLPLAACAPGASSAPADGPAPSSASASGGAAREASFGWASSAGEGGAARRYRLFVPASYDPGRPAPLLVMLHGCTQDPDDFARGTRMNDVAAEHGMLVAYPEQTAAGNPQKCWSWYDPAHQERGRGEPEDVARITREVMAAHRVDPARVYVAGVSAGGAMALILAAAYPDLYAAAGAHSAIAYRAAAGVQEALGAMQRGAPDTAALGPALLRALGERGRPVPLIVFQGAQDPVVREVNAGQVVAQWTAALRQAGVRLEGRAAEQSSAPGASWRRETIGDADGRGWIEHWTVAGLGHAWSGGSPEGTFTDARGPDASREMVRFFLQHPRESR